MPKILQSSVIAAPLPAVWRLIRDFNALPEWHPAVLQSAIEDGQPADRIGSVRNYIRRDNLRLRERLLCLDDATHRCTYELLGDSIPVTGYEAGIRLWPVTDTGYTFAQWHATFACAPEDEARLVAAICEVFASGLNALGRIGVEKEQ